MAPNQTSPGSSSRLTLSQEYYNMRMRDDESLRHFRQRVHDLRVRLGYEVSDPNTKSAIDFWLTRFSPLLLKRLKADVGDDFEFNSIPQLFDRVRSCEIYTRIEAARKYQEMRMRNRDETLGEFMERMDKIERKLGYKTDNPESRSQKRLIDGWLLRLPHALVERLLVQSDSLRSVKTEKQLLEHLKELRRVDESNTEQSDTQGQEDSEDSEDDSDEDSESEDDGPQEDLDSDSSSPTSSSSSSSGDDSHGKQKLRKAPVAGFHVGTNGLQKDDSSSSESSSESSSDSSSQSNDDESEDSSSSSSESEPSDNSGANDKAPVKEEEEAGQNNTNKRNRGPSEQESRQTGKRKSQQHDTRAPKRQRPNPPASATSEDSSSADSMQLKVMKWVDNVEDALHPHEKARRQKRDRKGRFCASA